MEVELLRLELDDVAGPAGLYHLPVDAATVEHLAELRHPLVKGADTRGRGRNPEVDDQLLNRHNGACVEQQPSQERPLTTACNLDVVAGEPHIQRPEDPEFERLLQQRTLTLSER